MDNQTIYALSTVYGKSGVAVIRISGKDALAAVSRLTPLDVSGLKPRYAYFTNIYDSVSRETLDKCLLLYFKAPASFTGEDIVEFQIHGSRAVIASLMENLGRLKNFRLAEPGEFSRRAFYNGKMDLTEAEGLADLIDSETSEQQKYAMRQMEGGLKNLYDGWREELIKILAYLEAYIDFPDEDIPQELVDKLLNDVFKLQTAIDLHLKGDAVGERLREGFRVVIVGPPNAGKSSLLKLMVQHLKDTGVLPEQIIEMNFESFDFHKMSADDVYRYVKERIIWILKAIRSCLPIPPAFAKWKRKLKNRALKSLFVKLPTPIWYCVCLMPQKTLFKSLIILKILLKTKRYLSPINLTI